MLTLAALLTSSSLEDHIAIQMHTEEKAHKIPRDHGLLPMPLPSPRKHAYAIG